MDLRKTNLEFQRLAQPEDQTWGDVIERFIQIELHAEKSKWIIDDLDLDLPAMEWVMRGFYALPNSAALATAGLPVFMGSNCFSSEIEDDSLDGITRTLGFVSLNSSLGGGNGISFDRLRSCKETVRGSAGLAGGPVRFMQCYADFMNRLPQGLRRRAAACMGTLSDTHLDILDWIRAKDPKYTPEAKDPKYLGCFNLSVAVHDSTMMAMQNNDPILLTGRKDNITSTIGAGDLLWEIADSITRSGDPGLFWIDRCQQAEGEIEVKTLNVCGESLLGNDGVCMLGSINLPKWVVLGSAEKSRVVKGIVDILTFIIWHQRYPHEIQAVYETLNRQIGIGGAGLATVLAIQGIPYSDPRAREITSSIYSDIQMYALEESHRLYNVGVMNNFEMTPFQNNYKRIHSSLTSQAPTSTLSRIFDTINEQGCGYGVEPFFSEIEIINSGTYGVFKRTNKVIPFTPDQGASIEYAVDIEPKVHIDIMAAAQKHIELACSKTINCKSNISTQEVVDLILYGYQMGLKGLTIYPDNCRGSFISQKPRRPKSLPCEINHTTVRGEKWTVLVGIKDDKPYEVFAGLHQDLQIPIGVNTGNIEKRGSDHYQLDYSNGEARTIKDIVDTSSIPVSQVITRLTSVALRHGLEVKELAKTLSKDGDITDFNRAIARVLRKYIPNQTDVGSCPVRGCSGKMIVKDGCTVCDSCGYSKCL